jgi:hypothetical protein
MKTSFLYAIAFVLMATQFSCKKSDSNPVGGNTNTNDFLWPFNTGNTWLFKVTSYDTLGNVRSTSYDTMLVGRDTTISGQKWFQAFVKTTFWTNKSDGVWTIDIGSSSQTPQLAYKYPGQAGESWTYNSLQVSILSVSASINIGSSSYVCYEYKFDFGSGQTEYDYFKPGVGLIVVEQFGKTNSGLQYKNFRMELISYTLK